MCRFYVRLSLDEFFFFFKIVRVLVFVVAFVGFRFVGFVFVLGFFDFREGFGCWFLSMLCFWSSLFKRGRYWTMRWRRIRWFVWIFSRVVLK